MTNIQFKIAVATRIFSPLLKHNEDLAQPRTCICPACNGPSDVYGYHAYSCGKAGHAARTQQHDALVNVWCGALRHAGYKVLHEPKGQVLANGKRPDLILRHVNGTSLFGDVRTCDPQLPSHLNLASTTPGHAARLGEASKIRDWQQTLDSQGDSFIALCHERGGLISDGALNLLKLASQQISPSLGSQTAYLHYWRTRLHLVCSRGTADVIKSKLPFYAEDPLSSQPSSPFAVYPIPTSVGAYVPLPPPIPVIR